MRLLLAAGSLIAGAVWSVALTPDGRRVLTASEDFTARVWDVVSGNCAHVLDGHTGWVVHVCTTQDGLRCATASHDGTARWVSIINKPVLALTLPQLPDPFLMAGAQRASINLSSGTAWRLLLLPSAIFWLILST